MDCYKSDIKPPLLCPMMQYQFGLGMCITFIIFYVMVLSYILLLI